MHHYPFHPGDYMLDTAHLEPMEDLAYRRLLDLYYTSEAPIPNDNQKLSKRLRLGFEVINQVLSEFFILENDVWKHTRCDAEIAAYQRKRDALSSNGKLGGRPKKTKGKPNGKQKETKSLASACNQNQEPEPRTKNHSLFMARIGGWFHRRPSTAWSAKELKALDSLPETSEEEMNALEQRYLSTDREIAKYRRQEILTLLNNWGGEVIRAMRDYKTKKIEDERLF